jgi:hypothetical protein
MEKLRRIFLEGVAHQIGLAQDPSYTYPSHEFAKQDGKMVKLVTYQSPEPWWYEEDGTVYLRLNFGERTLLIPGKNPVIRVGERSNLLAILEALHIMVDDRKMDDIIEKMVVVSR